MAKCYRELYKGASSGSPRTMQSCLAAKEAASRLLGEIEQHGPLCIPRTPKETPIPLPDYIQSHGPSNNCAYPMPPSQQLVTSLAAGHLVAARDLSSREERCTIWSTAINSRAPCNFYLQGFLHQYKNTVPSLSEAVPCITSNTGRFCYNCYINTYYLPYIIVSLLSLSYTFFANLLQGNPLIISLIADLYFMQVILNSLRHSTNPYILITQENILSVL